MSPLCANKWVEIDMSCDCVCCVSGQSSGSSCLFLLLLLLLLILFLLSSSRCLRFWVSFPVRFNSKTRSFCNYLLCLRTSLEHLCFDALNVLFDALGLLVHSSSDLSLIFLMPMPMSRNYRPYGLYRPLFPGQLRQMHSNETRNHKESIN